MKGKTQRYLDSHPEARKVKAATDKKINSRPDQIKKRTELNKYNREKGTYGNGDGKDASHKNGKITGFVKAKINRGNSKNSVGDRNSRGKK
jgi:hypothetical protein